MRQHEEFVWLHDRFVENEEYAGIIVSSFNQPVFDVICLRCIFFFLYSCFSLSFNNNKMSVCMFMQIPPAPPRPDFEASREKLQKLGDGEGTMTKEEFTKMKQELEA